MYAGIKCQVKGCGQAGHLWVPTKDACGDTIYGLVCPHHWQAAMQEEALVFARPPFRMELVDGERRLYPAAHATD